ncbi:ABC transporter permease subunit [Leifsonia sp. L25]|uniref:ABC transporter permease subunit n=1 Tax=Actinomycetes TaxID=1760 RepID=UPI003D692717
MIGKPTSALFQVLKVVLGLAYLLPLIWIVLTSLKTNSQVLQDPNAVLFTPTLSTYAQVIGSGLGAIVTSLQIGVIVTLAVLVVAVPAAFALARRITPLWARVIAVVLAALLVLQMVPQPMTVIPLYSVLASWGILGTLPGLILADIALFLPFAIMLLRPFVLSIPTALYEAAEIDGASTWQAFRSITVPMLSNGIFTVMSVIFISAWGSSCTRSTSCRRERSSRSAASWPSRIRPMPPTGTA